MGLLSRVQGRRQIVAVCFECFHPFHERPARREFVRSGLRDERTGLESERLLDRFHVRPLNLVGEDLLHPPAFCLRVAAVAVG